jgi:AcrR family transcriptional regulator
VVKAAAREATKDRILRATLRTLATNGFAGTTARTIATTGGFAPGVHLLLLHRPGRVCCSPRPTTPARAGRALPGRGARRDLATQLVERLKALYAEDTESGHIEAVQELVAAARPGSALAMAISQQVRDWEALAEQVLRGLLRGTNRSPARQRPRGGPRGGGAVPRHADPHPPRPATSDRPTAAFAQAARLARAFDKLPRLKR